MEENRRALGWKLFPAELAILILGSAGMWFFGRIRQIPEDRLLGGCVTVLLGLAVTGFHFRREYLRGELDYNNGEHVFRFWICMGACLAVAFVCGFLPVAGWPFLLVYVLLALFGNMTTGLLGASVLLVIPVTLGGGSVNGYALYLISGAFALTLFRHLEKDFHIGIPLTLSILCLLVCETACTVLPENARPDAEMFLVPGVNMIITSILLLGCLKLFSSMVVYQHRNIYLEVNDTEAAALADLREKDRQEYMRAVHTAYFCERIGMRLGLDVDALKCAGYYHRLKERKEDSFPPAAAGILEDYRNNRNRVRRKETAVLVCADTVVASVSEMLRREPENGVDYDRVIDGIFDTFLKEGSFDLCSVTMREFRMMQRIFKEEKLYYDFLR